MFAGRVQPFQQVSGRDGSACRNLGRACVDSAYIVRVNRGCGLRLTSVEWLPRLSSKVISELDQIWKQRKVARQVVDSNANGRGKMISMSELQVVPDNSCE